MFKKEGDLAYARTIQIRFPVLPCESNYNCILRRTTLKLLGEVSSTIHLKLRYTTRILFISHKNIGRKGAQFRRNCSISYHSSYQMVCRYKGCYSYALPTKIRRNRVSVLFLPSFHRKHILVIQCCVSMCQYSSYQTFVGNVFYI
jgi:hypothetical protein